MQKDKKRNEDIYIYVCVCVCVCVCVYNGKEEVKLFLFLGDMMVCMENTKESTNIRTRRKIGKYTGLI